MIFFKNISYQVEVKELLDNINFSIFQNQKIGLIGKNGTGKTTLFNLIQKNIEPDKGSIDITKNTRIVTVKQDIDDFEVKVIDYVINGIKLIKDLKQKMNIALIRGNFLDYAEYHEEYESQNGYSIESKANKLLLGLGFNTIQLEQNVKELSGGRQTLLNLAQALLQESDILLLDEPTNHLDLNAVLWLEQYLQDYKGSLFLISHDRIFLDNVVKKIFHIDNKKIIEYTGNYSSFETLFYEKKILQEKHFKKQQKKIDHLESFIDRFKSKASKAKQAQSRIKMLNKIERIESLKSSNDFNFEFKQLEKGLNGTLVDIIDVNVGYAGKTILSNIDLSIYNNKRIGLLGLNGSGKSTLIKSLIGDIKIISGEIKKHMNIKIGYFSQHSMDVIDSNISPLLHMQRLDSKASEQTLRTFLGSFNFIGEKALSQVNTFSGGEKARLALAIIVYGKPNFLLLDEPTNHLDMNIREALNIALQKFQGAIILISHDRFLLESTVDEYILVENGKVNHFEGSISDYYTHTLNFKKLENSFKECNKNKKKIRITSDKPEQKILKEKAKKIEKKLELLEGKKISLEKILSNQNAYKDKKKLQITLDEHEDVKKNIESTELQWIKVLEFLEN